MNYTPPGERRGGARITFETRVHVTTPGCKEQILMSSDWTKRSVFVRTRSPLASGTRVEMSLIIGRPAQLVKLAGVVTRVTSPPERRGQLNPKGGMAVVL